MCLIDVLYQCRFGRRFELCIVDDASLYSEAELIPLINIKLDTLLLAGDMLLNNFTTQNAVNQPTNFNFLDELFIF